MKYDADFDEKKENGKPYPWPKESDCGEVKIKAENVYITINCKEKKERKDY